MSYIPKTFEERVLHRYKIARGQLDKVIAMLESDTYCMDVLHQSNALQKALQQADGVLLEKHLRTCVLDAAQNGRAEEALAEVLEVFKKK
jgi:DNA-binding FrmR family transcriptional regulator